VATDAPTRPSQGGPDLYALLGVAPSATTAEITAAFRERAKDMHPDRAPDPQTAERFKELSEAYAILVKPERRARYDAQRSARRGARGAPSKPATPKSHEMLATPGRARGALIGGIVCIVLGLAITPVLLSLETDESTLGRDVTLWIVVAKLVICGAILVGAGWWRLAMLRAKVNASSSSGARAAASGATGRPVPTQQ